MACEETGWNTLSPTEHETLKTLRNFRSRVDDMSNQLLAVELAPGRAEIRTLLGFVR